MTDLSRCLDSNLYVFCVDLIMSYIGNCYADETFMDSWNYIRIKGGTWAFVKTKFKSQLYYNFKA